MPEADPPWLNVLDLASLERMRSMLVRWKDSPSDRRGCFDISEPTAVAPTMALTDESCLVLLVCRQLHVLGWLPYSGDFVHTTDTDMRFDGSHASITQRLLPVFVSVQSHTGSQRWGFLGSATNVS